MSSLETVTFPRNPTPADLARLTTVSKKLVSEISTLDGALGSEAIALLYAQGLYKAVVEGGESPAPVASRPRVGLGLAKPQATVVTATFDPAELAAWTTVVSTLLNLDETITKP